MDRKIEDIRPVYRRDVTCQGSVPESVIAFLESDSFEDAVRTVISLGGDTDTTGAITGSIAEAYFGIPQALKMEVNRYVPPRAQKVLQIFSNRVEKWGEILGGKAS